MRRRRFLRGAALGTGATLLGAGAVPAVDRRSGVRAEAVRPTLARLRSRVEEAPPPITEEERAARRAEARRIMAEHGIDAMLIEPGANLDYFAGIRWGRSERLFALLIPRDGESVLVAPAFEEARARNAGGGRFEIRVWQEDESPWSLLAEAVRGIAGSAATLAVDDTARYFVVEKLARAAPRLPIVSAEPVLHGTRGRKSAHELEIMRFANTVTLDAIHAAFGTLREGMTQRELAANVAAAHERQGFPGGWALALIGESSAYPHGAESPRPLRRGDVVLIDAGTTVHDYESDITRTAVFGTPSPEQAEVWETVRRAQAAALTAARPGRTAGEIDAVARGVIDAAGYGPDYRLFTHRLGHGIGLEGHEWPYLVRGSDVVLEPGMTFSNEPGIYQYGEFGVRLEDIMVITDTGAELLTPAATSPALPA